MQTAAEYFKGNGKFQGKKYENLISIQSNTYTTWQTIQTDMKAAASPGEAPAPVLHHNWRLICRRIPLQPCKACR